MQMTRKRSRKMETHYLLNGEILEVKRIAKYLGVTLTDDLQ